MRGKASRGRVHGVPAAILFAACALVNAPHSTATAATSTPTLVFVTRPGHSLGMVGKHWGRHVIVTAQIGAARGIAVFGTIAGGAFVVALDFSVPCGGLSIEVRDLRGHDVSLKRPGPLCPNRQGEPPPTVTVLQGTRSATRTHRITYSTAPRTLTIRLGETLQLTEPGGSTPNFTPVADTDHFVLIQQESPGSASCMAACVPGGDAYWKWVAVKTGHGTVDLSPTCRQSQPPCEIAERAIDTRITP